MAGDRYIVRRFSPLLTIGGGEILDPSPLRSKRSEKLRDLRVFELGSLGERLSLKVLHSGLNGLTQSDIEGWIKAEIPEIQKVINALVSSGSLIRCEGRYLHKDVFDGFSARIVSILSGFHKENPLKPGMQKETLRAAFRNIDPKLFEAMLGLGGKAAVEKEIVRLKTFTISLSDDKKLLKDKIRNVLEQAEFQPHSSDELAQAITLKKTEVDELLKIMASEKSLVRINDSLYIPMSNYMKMMERLRTFFSKKNEMTVGEFRDILKTTRKYALPFLEYLDSNKITLRVGEIRKFLLKK